MFGRRPVAYVNPNAGTVNSLQTGADRWHPIYESDHSGLITLLIVAIIVGGVLLAGNALIGSYNYERCDKVTLCGEVVRTEQSIKVLDASANRQAMHKSLQIMEDAQKQAAAIAAADVARERVVFQPKPAPIRVIPVAPIRTVVAPMPHATYGAVPYDFRGVGVPEHRRFHRASERRYVGSEHVYRGTQHVYRCTVGVNRATGEEVVLGGDC
jgi:hypothetical protein